jgi:CMP-N,N'-diacetyllegionaminic acid synthase
VELKDKHKAKGQIMLSDGTQVIALIPARGGSKGILRKNLALLAGKPLISYTINAAKRSKLIDEIWISSDDEEILNVSENLGAKILNRPKQLSDDDASAVDVVNHFIDFISNKAGRSEAIILYLQPTSPLRNESHIDGLLQAMQQAAAIGAISVVDAEKPPHKAFRLDNNGHLQSLFDERLSNARRQDLPKCYYPNGAMYAFRISEFVNRQGFPSNGSIPFIMSCINSIDIDNTTDLKRAEAAIGEKNGRV